MKSNTRRIAKNTLMLYFRQILTMLVSLYTVRVVLNTLGAEGGAFCIQVCYEPDSDNQDREIKGLCAALDFFNASEGVIITRDARDLILKAGKKIALVPEWEWAGG
jgi:hypothetical protein